MNTKIELPPLPDGWADGPVEIRYGLPPLGSMVLTCFGWDAATGADTPFVHAVKKWVPAIVQSHLLQAGWLVIDEAGAYWYSERPVSWSDDAREWKGFSFTRLYLRETPQLTGRNAIWEIK